MARIPVRDLKDDLKTKLRRRGGRSTEEEARETRRDKGAQPALGTRIVQCFAGSGVRRDVPEFKRQKAGAATFDE